MVYNDHRFGLWTIESLIFGGGNFCSDMKIGGLRLKGLKAFKSHWGKLSRSLGAEATFVLSLKILMALLYSSFSELVFSCYKVLS